MDIPVFNGRPLIRLLDFVKFCDPNSKATFYHYATDPKSGEKNYDGLQSFTSKIGEVPITFAEHYIYWVSDEGSSGGDSEEVTLNITLFDDIDIQVSLGNEENSEE